MKVSALDAVKLGSQGAAVKSQVSKKQWTKIIKYAKGHGFTVAGAVSGNPTPLKERTHKYLLNQAKANVAKAYDPALTQLDTQQSQLKAISDKRQADNASYEQWLIAQKAKYDAQAATSQQQYTQYLDNLKATTEAAHQQAQAGAQAAVQGQAGTVSDISQSSAIQGLSADTAKATGLVDNARQQTAAMLPSLEMRSDARTQAIYGQHSADEAKRVNDLNTGLTALGDQRFKVLAAKASDTLKAYTDSLNQQVDIANSNRSYQAAADKLGLDQQKFQFDQTKSNRDYKLNVKKESAAELDARARREVDYSRIRATKGEGEANRRLRLQIAKDKANAQKKGGNAPKFTATQSAKALQDVQTAAGMYKDLHDKHISGVLNNGQTLRQYLRGKGVSDTLINIAQDMYAHGGGLTAYGRKLAKSLGVTHPFDQIGKADVGTSYQGPN